MCHWSHSIISRLDLAGQDPSEALEALHWLTRMSAHFLADSGDGEVPYVPTALAHASESSPLGQDPVEALSHSLLGVVGLCLDENGRHIASPRSMLICPQLCAKACRPSQRYKYSY